MDKTLASDRDLHIYVGGGGINRPSEDLSIGQDAGGYNGGGMSAPKTSNTCGRASGGGASDVRTSSNELNSRLIVAAGGGGADSESLWWRGNQGGPGRPGGAFTQVYGLDGAQTKGGGSTSVGLFGIGANGTNQGPTAGGGGGWYGGGSGGGGGGGSSYAAGHSQCPTPHPLGIILSNISVATNINGNSSGVTAANGSVTIQILATTS